ncbi:MAG: shikimate dehydrogenase [Gammaproteobacteria bacterium]
MADPDRYAVIGHPIAHSKSPIIHSLFAKQTEQDMSYEAMDVAPENLREEVLQFIKEGGKGLNITVPHKQNILAVLAKLTERAEIAGAVNTIFIGERGELIGDNTDGAGLLADLRNNLDFPVRGARVLILGAGGAVRGIIPALVEQSPDELVIANRTVDKARNLAEHFSELTHIRALGFDKLENKEYELIINATSAGLSGDMPPFPPSIIREHTLCYDLSYSMKETPFTAWAREHGGLNVFQGWGMLIEQAAESFYIWRNVRPDTRSVIEQLR